MPIITWNDSMSVKVAEIDKQHQKLVQLINDLHDAMREGKAKTVLGSILGELANYTVTHFNYEEMLFEKYNFPLATTHQNEHRKFIKTVSEFKAKFEEGNASVTLEIMNFLKDWLVNHIQGTDKQYSSFLNKNGVV